MVSGLLLRSSIVMLDGDPAWPDLLEQWPDGEWAPDLATGATVQAVCEAIEPAIDCLSWAD